MSKEIEIVIPDEVVNPVEYKKWIALKKHPILSNCIYTTSEGEDINYAMLPHMLQKKINHLAPKEQEAVLELKAKWNVINMRCQDAKAMAFGKKGRYGGRPKEVASVITPLENDIVELLGRLFTTQEIVKIMADDYGTVIHPDDVREVMKKYVVEVEKKREDFRNKITDVRLYNKRPRLEELAWMYSKMKNRYIALNSTEAYNSMLRTLEQIRKESEGDILNIRGNIEMNVEIEIQQQIQMEMMKTLNLKEIILGRVAARMNYDFTKLVTSLHNSYYSKFITISGDFDPEAGMTYPSQQNYDFNRISLDAAQEAEVTTPEDITDKEKAQADRIREMFLNKIKAQQSELNKRKAVVEQTLQNKFEEVEEEKPIKRDGRNQDNVLKGKKKDMKK